MPDSRKQICRPAIRVRDNLAEITRATNRAADLVRRILGFSRPQDERQSPISLRPVVEEAVNLLRASLPAMIHMTTRYADDLPYVTANATQMHQVVVNLGPTRRTRSAYAAETWSRARRRDAVRRRRGGTEWPA